MSREQFWFFHPFRVRYSEIDGQGVVFNAHYLTYFDTTITEYFRALGYDQFADAKATGIDFHVVKSLIEYKAPVLFDWEIEVGARVARIGNSSLTFELAIFRNGGTDHCAQEVRDGGQQNGLARCQHLGSDDCGDRIGCVVKTICIGENQRHEDDKKH